MLDIYNPFDHMWAVSGRDDVYSSGLDTFVAADGTEVQAWLSAVPDRAVGNIASLDELHDVLVNAGAGERYFGNVELWRKTAEMPKADFVIGARRAGLVSNVDALPAIRGDWPSTFDPAIASFSVDDQLDAKMLWAGITQVRRNAPLLTAIVAAKLATDAQLDALFGWPVK